MYNVGEMDCAEVVYIVLRNLAQSLAHAFRIFLFTTVLFK